MRNNRLLYMAVALIAIGIIGIAAASWFGAYERSVYRMPPMMDMMGGPMIGRGHMKEMMQRMMPGLLPPAVRAESLPDRDSRGAKLLVRYCSQCHHLPSPVMHTAGEWPMIADRMFYRMSMMSGMMGIESPSPEEQRMIVDYLKAHAMRSIPHDMLPSPETHGAVLFKDICSQCHSLPDPKLHTAEEWPMIVDRMQAHMQSMGKRVVTENEEKEIVRYLEDNARK